MLDVYSSLFLNKLRKLLILVGVMTMGHHCCAGNSAWRALRVKINDKYGFDAREVASPVAYGKFDLKKKIIKIK